MVPSVGVTLGCRPSSRLAFGSVGAALRRTDTIARALVALGQPQMGQPQMGQPQMGQPQMGA